MTALNQLLYRLNIFSGASWANLFNGFVAKIGRIVYAVIIIAIGRIADICQLVFKKLAGISNSGVAVDGKVTNGDVVLAFLQHDIVKNLVFSMVILGLIILLMATFVATIKTEFAKDGNNNKRKVIKNAFRGLANFVLVPVICMFGLIVGNGLLRAIDGATSIGSSTLSSQIFLAGGYNANRVREGGRDSSDPKKYANGSFGAKLTGNNNTGANGVGNFGVFFDDDSSKSHPLTAADKIDNCFANNVTLVVGQGLGQITYYKNLPSFLLGWDFSNYGDSSTEPGGTYVIPQTAYSNMIHYAHMNIWYGGACADDLGIMCLVMDSGGDLVSRTISAGGGNIIFSKGATITFSYYNVGLVYYYYNTNLGHFSYLISLVCMLYCAFILLVTALGLVKRIFYLSVLFVISAPICSTYPLDDGKILERWRTEFIKYALSAYSVVVVMNLFLSLLPVFLRMELFTYWGEIAPIPLTVGFVNYVAKVLIVCGALMFFKDASKAIATIIGATDSDGDGSGKSKAFGARLAGASGMLVGGAALAKIVGTAGKAVAKKASDAKDNKFAAKHQAEADKIMEQQEETAKANGNGKGTDDANSMNLGGGGDNGNGGNVSGPTTGGKGIATNNGADDVAGRRSLQETSKSSNNIILDKNGNIDWHASRLKAERNKKLAKGAEKRYGKIKDDNGSKIKEVMDEAKKKGIDPNKAVDEWIKQKDENNIAESQERKARRKAMLKNRASAFGNAFKGFAGGVVGIGKGDLKFKSGAGLDKDLGKKSWLSGTQGHRKGMKGAEDKRKEQEKQANERKFIEGTIASNVGKIVEEQIKTRTQNKEMTDELKNLKSDINELKENTKPKK